MDHVLGDRLIPHALVNPEGAHVVMEKKGSIVEHVDEGLVAWRCVSRGWKRVREGGRLGRENTNVNMPIEMFDHVSCYGTPVVK